MQSRMHFFVAPRIFLAATTASSFDQPNIESSRGNSIAISKRGRSIFGGIPVPIAKMMGASGNFSLWPGSVAVSDTTVRKVFTVLAETWDCLKESHSADILQQ